MAYTKEQFVELVRISLEGGIGSTKEDNRFHPEVLGMHVQMAYNDVVSQIKDTNILDQFSKTYYPIDVLTDNDTSEKYSTLPAALLNTVMGSGLRMVCALKDSNYMADIRKNNSQWTMGELEVSQYFTKFAGRVDGKRFVYDIIDSDITQVRMKLIPGFQDLDDDDEIYMPGGKDSFIFRAVMEQLMPQYKTPTAMKNDTNPNTK
jgi:hypothetical protein